MTVTWPGGLRLAYNLEFSPRTREMAMQSYSVPLRPDIALTVADGPRRGLHLLDAKFRLRRVAELVGEDIPGTDRGRSGVPGADEEATEERLEAEERRGTFKRADLYKMHTYRDAIRGARSVWALYPGDEARFFPAAVGDNWAVARDGASDGRGLPASAAGLDGVGALPLVPGPNGCGWVERWVALTLG